jgi:outer membrane protein
METRTTTWRLVLLGALAVAAGLATATPAAAQRIAVVDMQKALNDCADGRRAKDEVKRKFESAQESLRREREALDRAREDYDKRALVLREEERRNLERSLENRTLEFKRKYEDFQRDLKAKDAELTAGIVEQLYKITQEYARERQYDLVLEASSGGILYAQPAMDITAEIVKRKDRR